MVKLEGIIYKTFDHYVVLRGFAPIKDLAAISHKPESYQRPAINEHKKDIIKFLDSGEYKYFPEITLACRVDNYTEFASNIGIDNAVNRDDAQYVNGLRVLVERLPDYSYRARHAYLTKSNNDELVRVDGNHRLEPFDDKTDKVWSDTGASMSDLGKLVVPYTVIFSEKEFGDKFEAGIFHNINFRQEPLRQEASLKIISDLNVFDDIEKLGDAYPLALELIKKTQNGIFNGINWLTYKVNVSDSYYRTSCLKIAQLIISQKGIIEEHKFNVDSDIESNSTEITELSSRVSDIKSAIIDFKTQRNEIEKSNFKLLSEYKTCIKDIESKNDELVKLEYEISKLETENEHLRHKQGRFSKYLSDCESPSKIMEAIHSLKSVYESFEENQYGNIAMLAAMVYYAILDRAQLNAFIDWAKKNGVNKIIAPDDLSKDASENLINMFDQIFQSKRNEIFISMQFSDSQSELIYEKIVRAIETFNTKHKSIHLYARPIRIDRTVGENTYSIQDEILKAIKSCSLIIADLSSANINVYHEIGYAMGLAQSNSLLPNMILLYKENTDHNKNSADIDKFIGFNLRNLSQLRFKDYKQLVDGLVERLEKHYGVK